jgi:parallel beta-helix repeat protein
MKNTKFKNSIISRHTAVGNKGQGIWCDIDCDNIEISASVVSGNSETGIFYEISKRSLIVNNIVYDNGSSGICISASSGCNIINNLVYANFRGIVIHGVPRTYSGVIYELRNNSAQNNILINNTDADIVVAPNSPNASDNRSDYNLYYYQNGKSIFKLGYDRTLQGISAWQAASGNDVHSNETPPRFTDLSQHNFRPVAGSPAIGKGLPNNLVDVDFDGNPRDKKRNDIGPFQIN